jgi:energy-coupling factor transporter ATP-binding protein EcfA2
MDESTAITSTKPRSVLGPRSSSRRRVVDAHELELEAPFVPWSTMYAHLRREFRQGDHVAIIGPTGSGKTHIAFPVAELRSHTIVVACKPRDELVQDALGRGYYLIPTDTLKQGIEYVDGRALHPRVVYWPRLGERAWRGLPEEAVLQAEKAHQRPRVGAALGYVRKQGKWSIMLDEGTWVCRDLGLQRDVDSALFQFRSLRSSIIILGQRPSWMGRYVLSSPTHLFLFNTNDGDDRKALGNVSGVDSKLVAELVARLSFERHEVLYIDTRRREMFRTVAPPR